VALAADFDELQRAARLFFEGDSVVELRAPKSLRDQVISGYFSDPQKLAQSARSIDQKAPGVYVTLNPCNPVLLARADNKIKSRARELTVDADIVRRRWLLLDFDPKRPAGISSSDEEHDAAIRAARSAAKQLAEFGWPLPVWGDSGNGGHLLYRIDLPNDQESADLVKSILLAASQRWTTDGVDVDRSVFNASRISKVYGSVARKGDSTQSRPHRISRILSLPEQLQPVSVELLKAFASEARTEPPRSAPKQAFKKTGDRQELELERFIVEHAIAIARGPDVHQGSERWVLEHCPFNPDHRAPDAAIFRVLATGRLGFKCLHNSCSGKDWSDFREFYEPKGSRPQKAAGFQPFAPIPGERDSRDEIPANPADVEKAADEAIAANDVAAAMRLIPELAKLRRVSQVVIVAKLRQHFKRIWKDREFTQALNEAMDAQRSARTPPPDDRDPDAPAPDGVDLLPFPLTDAGNGERIAAMFAGEIRYCVEMKSWLVWDAVRWVVDHFDVMRQKAKAMARLLYEQAERGDRPTVKSFARGSESYGATTAALQFASTEPGIRITAAELDQHPYLLNCPNGVVDLRDGKILPHNREFLITKLCPIIYNPSAKCDRFLGFLQWAMGANPDAEISERTARLVGFLQRAFGYALTSDVSEKAVFVFYGKQGNNGKTTLLSLLRDLLGRDYSGQIAIETVMATAKQQDATIRADLADLRGVRFVVTSEVERESKLNERTIKYITAGNAPIKSCRKYENPIEFWATHKLFMDCNHRPTIRGSEDAIWKRLKLVPFEVQIDDGSIDKQLPDKLRAEMQGILVWAVRGCMEWIRNGLGEPPEIKAAGKEWRDHDDSIKEFLDDCCNVDLDTVKSPHPEERLFVPVSDLTAAYRWWAKQHGEKFPLGREGLKEKLESKGFWENRSRRINGIQTRTWEGLELRREVALRSGENWEREG